MQLVAVLTALVGAISVVQATPVEVEARDGGLRYCGSQPYYPSDYTCYPQNNNLLCPILGGVVYQPCGRACYDPANYGCSNGQLYPVTTCSGIPFDKNSYVCVDGQLCPKGAPNRCGAACYNLAYYWCDNGVLKQQGQK